MTLDQLRIFAAVARHSHVTRAAAALNLGQSAVSAAIAALEARHGAQLFHRAGRGIALTATGAAFLPAAEAVLAEAGRAEALLAALTDAGAGTLRLQASQTISSYWLPRHLAAFRRAHPGVALDLTIGNTAEVAAAILRGGAELGFVEGPVEAPALHQDVIARDQLIVLVAPSHPWADATPADLTTSAWVMREPGSGTRAEFEAALGLHGIDPAALTIALELPSNEAVRGAVEAGLGATALSASVAAPSLEAGLLAVVDFPLPARNFSVLHHAARRLSPAAAALRAQLTRGSVSPPHAPDTPPPDRPQGARRDRPRTCD
jgi:DNA-binding transcriptional LysR family regulator